MTNQASEDELREQLADKLEWYSRYRERDQDDDMDRAFDDILALIRAEKLKLLDEVIHQSTVNLKSAKAVAGWAELRKEQLGAEL